MKIIFRADANKNIGFGHAMRCMSLADAFVKKGQKCIFVEADESFAETITNRGYECRILNSDYRNMEGEIDLLEEILEKEKPDLLIIDSYYVTNEYLSNVKKKVKTVYFDDVLAFPYNADILVNYNVYADENGYKKLYDGLSLPKLILGTKYAPLRNEFSNAVPKKLREKAKNVLVSVGGSDPYHIAESFVKMIDSFDELKNNLVFDFVLSNMQPDLLKIKEFAQKVSWLNVYENVKDMKALMDKADMAVSASGSTQYELCACGVPTVNYAFADNQLEGGEKFGKDGIFIYAGDLRNNNDFYGKVGNILTELYKDYDRRKQMSERAYALIDGYGAERLAEELMHE